MILVIGTTLLATINAGAVAKGEGEAQPAPADLREMAGQPVVGNPRLRWKYVEILVEWGFKEGTEQLAFDGNIESTYELGAVGAARPLPEDKVTTLTGQRTWKSPPSGAVRRGIVVPVLYTDAVRGPGRTIVTVRTSSGSFSFQPVDLATGPILAPEYGFFVRVVSQPTVPPVVREVSQVLPPANLLKAKMDSREGGVTIRGWGTKDTPCIYANAGAEPGVFLSGAIRVPPRSITVHPGPDRDVAVGWRSPLAGKVDVKAKVADGHPRGGNGVEWSIVHDTKAGRNVLVGGAIEQGGSQTIPPATQADKLAALAVEPSDILSLVVGNRGSHVCDTTCIELTIAEVGGAGRMWDMAGDVVGDIQAANPHADSLGNEAVWYFYAPMWAREECVPGAPPIVVESKATTARQYIAELATGKLKTIRQKVREHPEQTWEGAMRAMHGDVIFPPFPKPPFEPKMSVEVPCKYLTALWKLGAWQIIKNCPRIHRADIHKVGQSGDVHGLTRVDPNDPNGVYVVRDNPFPPLGCETDRILWALDHMGMHDVARDGMSIWLENQQKDGSLMLNSGIEKAHMVGALQLMWVMTEHYRLTGDKQWLEEESPRLKAVADWIINRRRATMKDKEELSQQEIDGIKAGTWSPYGLQPKVSMGDGNPSGSRYYYWADSSGYQSVKLLADVIADVDRGLGRELLAEAEKYRKDFLPVLNESIVLSPVMKVRDGTYRSFLPQGFQDRGPLAVALPEGANIYSHCGPYHADYCITCAAIEAWIRSGLLSVDDPRIDGHFDVVEDVFLLDHPWIRKRKLDYDPNGDWFGNAGWGYQSGWERLPEFYLVKDDVPNFLRAWLNRCAVDMNLSNWTFNEHTTFAANDKSHGNAVFLSNFRNMLLMEIGETLCLARATPRAWLEQGKKIAVRDAPTHFGTLAYEIVSDVDNGKIIATVEMPSRKAPKTVLLRFRHPQVASMKSVTVNGKAWTDFDKSKEAIRLQGLRGKLEVTALY